MVQPAKLLKDLRVTRAVSDDTLVGIAGMDMLSSYSQPPMPKGWEL